MAPTAYPTYDLLLLLLFHHLVDVHAAHVRHDNVARLLSRLAGAQPTRIERHVRLAHAVHRRGELGLHRPLVAGIEGTFEDTVGRRGRAFNLAHGMDDDFVAVSYTHLTL